MKIDVAVIAGTGFESALRSAGGTTVHVPTPFGLLRGTSFEHRGVSVLAVPRHMADHRLPPDKVPYRAMAAGLAKLGVKYCLSTAAVGSLRPEWEPGKIAICSDFIDVSARNVTMFEHKVNHQDFTYAFSPRLREVLNRQAAAIGLDAAESAVYMNVNGPRFETKAEITMFARLGADLVGMTAGTEAVAMRESQIPYACVAVVTNLACGIADGELRHGEVVDVMTQRKSVLAELLLQTAFQVMNG